MPRYRIHNPGPALIHLPEPLTGSVGPQRTVDIVAEPHDVNTPSMQLMLRKGVLRLDVFIDEIVDADLDVLPRSLASGVGGGVPGMATADAGEAFFADGAGSGYFALPTVPATGWKDSCRLATTGNIASLSGLLTVDGFAVSAGDRVLVKSQATLSQNGIYVAAVGAWARASDFAALEPGYAVLVREGGVNGQTAWQFTKAEVTLGPSDYTAAYDPNAVGGVTLSGADITSLNDLSGNGRHFTQAVTSEQPGVVDEGGIQVAEFLYDPGAAPNGQWLESVVGSNTFLGTNAFTILAEAKPQTDNPAGVFSYDQYAAVLMDTDGSGGLGFYTDAGSPRAIACVQVGFVPNASTSAVTLNAWYFMASRYTGGSIDLRLNDEDIVATAAGVRGNGAPGMLMGRGVMASSARFEGRTRRIRVFARALSNAEIEATYQEWSNPAVPGDIVVKPLDVKIQEAGGSILRWGGVLNGQMVVRDGSVLKGVTPVGTPVDDRFNAPPLDRVFAYDVNGNLESVTYADAKVKTLTYDVDGNLVTVEFDGSTKTLAYDVDGNLISIVFS